jgi:hypothetical protein
MRIARLRSRVYGAKRCLLCQADAIDAEVVDPGLRVGPKVAIAHFHTEFSKIRFLHQIENQIVGAHANKGCAGVCIANA